MVPQRPAPVPRPVTAPATVGSPRTGRFRCTTGTDPWVWSDEMFTIHGFAVGDVVPTSALVLSHCDPQDRDRLAAALRSASTDSTPVSLTYRLVDAAGREHWVLLVASVQAEDPGLRGTLTDLTSDLEVTAARRADAMIAASAESRATIDQAKGVLMLAYGLTGDDAFELLRWHSEHLNIKVRQLARRLLAALPPGVPAPVQVRALLEAPIEGRTATDAPEGPAGARSGHLTLASESDSSGVRVAAQGELDAATTPTLVTALLTALRQARGDQTVTVDLRAVSWVGATGAAHLDRLRRRSTESGATVRVLAPPRPARTAGPLTEPSGGPC